ncbi:MAG: hypothetical protein M3P37_07340 [Actinomycetota bacterium]|nr:hypothetical protein [Actinomycetota bacterium]
MEEAAEALEAQAARKLRGKAVLVNE